MSRSGTVDKRLGQADCYLGLVLLLVEVNEESKRARVVAMWPQDRVRCRQVTLLREPFGTKHCDRERAIIPDHLFGFGIPRDAQVVRGCTQHEERSLLLDSALGVEELAKILEGRLPVIDAADYSSGRAIKAVANVPILRKEGKDCLESPEQECTVG